MSDNQTDYSKPLMPQSPDEIVREIQKILKRG